MSDIMYHLPAVALRGTTILPDMIVHFDVSREKSIQAIEQAMMQDQRILLITQKNPETEEPVQEDLYPIGTIGKTSKEHCSSFSGRNRESTAGFFRRKSKLS